MEVENPGKQTRQAEPAGERKGEKKKREKKKQSLVVSWRKHLFHIRAFQAEMQRSPHPLSPEQKNPIYTSGRRVEAALQILLADWEAQVSSLGVPNEIWLLFLKKIKNARV